MFFLVKRVIYWYPRRGVTFVPLSIDINILRGTKKHPGALLIESTGLCKELCRNCKMVKTQVEAQYGNIPNPVQIGLIIKSVA